MQPGLIEIVSHAPARIDVPRSADTGSKGGVKHLSQSRQSSLLSDSLLALGLLLSTASQLRPQGAPIGPGEICLAVWLAMMLAKEMHRRGPPLTPALSTMLIFWLLLGFALCVGSLTGYAIEDVHDPNLFFHDAAAYPPLAAVSCLSVAGSDAEARLHRVARLFVSLGSIYLGLQLAATWGLDFGRIDPWYWDRFRGWSANPIQLAFLCAVLGLVSLHLADIATHTRQRIAALACMAISAYVGRLTKSDSFSIVLVAAGPLFLAFKLRVWLLEGGQRLSLRTGVAWIAVLAVPMTLIAALSFGSAVTRGLVDLADELSKDSSKLATQEAEQRFDLWGQAINRGLQSGLLGLGPGPHLEVPGSIAAARKSEVLPKFVEPPPANGTPNFEAHNTFLDLLTQGGLIAVLAFAGLVARAFIVPYRARLAGLTTLVCGLALFALPNLIVRHPTFWFALALCLVSTSASLQRASAASARN